MSFENKGNEFIEELTVDELKNLLNDSIEKCKAEETLLLNINHDLRGHLNVIISTLQYIEQVSKNNEGLDKYLGIIKRSCFKMFKLINNLIDTTKLQNNCYNLEKRNVNIVPMIEDTIDEVDKYAKQKEIDLIFDTNEEECIISVDPVALDRIIMNLLSNAIKFSPDNSEIYITLNISEDKLIISIKDQGIGISEEDKDKIFKRFYQCQIRENKSYIGSGIGLDLTNYLVQAHGGIIKINSEEGKGSEFIVTIPRIIDNTLEDIQEKEISSRTQLLELEFSDIYLN